MTTRNRDEIIQMTGREFQGVRQTLGLSLTDAAVILNTRRETIQKWERPLGNGPNPVAVAVMIWMQDGFRPPEWSE